MQGSCAARTRIAISALFALVSNLKIVALTVLYLQIVLSLALVLRTIFSRHWYDIPGVRAVCILRVRIWVSPAGFSV
jgi:hypothetical protein